MSVYLHDWAGGDLFSLITDFSDCGMSRANYEAEKCPWGNEAYWLEKKAEMAAELADEKWRGVEVLLACYTYEDYSGSAFVLFRKGGKLFEVNGAHCSCYGLEGQWEPEETTIESLTHRLDKGHLGRGEFADELRAVISQMEAA